MRKCAGLTFCLAAVLMVSSCLKSATMRDAGLTVKNGDSIVEELPLSAAEKSLVLNGSRDGARIPGLSRASVFFKPEQNGTIGLSVEIPALNIKTKNAALNEYTQAAIASSANPVRLTFEDEVIVTLDQNITVTFVKGSFFSFTFE